MLTRRSLGDSPLEHHSDDVALLDFIGKGQKSADSGLQIEETNVENIEEPELKPAKKIVSYYLDKEIIRKLKFLAAITDRSYSSLVSEGLKKLLREYGF